MLKILDRSITLQLLIFYGLFLLPLLLGGIELYLFQRDALQQHAQRTDLGIAQAIALEVESNVRAAVEDDVELARSQAASHLDLSQLATAFATARLSHPDISLYFVCDPSGHMLLSYPSMPVTIRQPGSFCEYPLEALHSDTPLISAGRVSPTTQTNVVSIVTRMINAQGHMVGMLGMNVSLAQYTAHLLEVQRQLSANGEVRIWIVDDEGQPLADTEHVPLQNDLRKSLPGLNNALRGEQGNLIARAQNREWLYSYLPIAGTHWAVIVQRPTDVTFATIISFQNSLLIALVTLIVGATFFWFALHGWVVAPLVKLAQAVIMIKLEMSQLEAGTLKLAPSFYRLDTLVEQVVSVEERGRMRVKLPEDVPLLFVDRRRIEVVLRNLLENARRYAGADAIIEIAARYEPGMADGGLYLSVADNGPGLPPHLTERIFDRFYQVDAGRQRSSSGVGLGLAICRGFIEAHGGRIWAENRTNGVTGAIFHIWLPPKLLLSPDTPGTQPNRFDLHNAL